MKALNFSLITLMTLICLSNMPAPRQTSRVDVVTYANKELADSLNLMDSILFDAFNNCKYEVFNDMFTKDLEFYHDKGGLTDYAYTVRSLKNKCALTWKVRRELVSGSLEVYPVPGYGAIQVGAHRFYNTEKGPETLGGTFKFVHIWKRDNGKWRISRVASYDH